MASDERERVVVVLALAGGNDLLNTLVPFTNPLYYDNRPTLGIPEDQVLRVDDEIGFHPSMVGLKATFDEGNMAIIQGVGYPHPNRSHFRSMDIWQTAEPDRVGTEGWLGRAIRDLDPRGENVLTGVNIGRGLPRAMVAPGVPVASVGNLATYGVMTDISEEVQRTEALEMFSRMYAPAIGSGPVMDYVRDTGRAVLRGADALNAAGASYSSEVEYANNDVAQGLRQIAQAHLADVGTRIFFRSYFGFDTHSAQAGTHARLWKEVSGAVTDFYQDLKDHNRDKEVLLFMFSEFGRRVRDNGSGTDHGTGGVSFVVGDQVRGGFYGEYPSLKPGDLEEGGDLLHNVDFRGVYATLLERWMGLDSKPIVGGTFEQLEFLP